MAEHANEKLNNMVGNIEWKQLKTSKAYEVVKMTQKKVYCLRIPMNAALKSVNYLIVQNFVAVL
jgi:hypothetical protein